MEGQIELTAEDLWNDVSVRLREALNDTTYSTWFGEVGGAELDGDTFAIAVPNDFTREWIEGHFLDLIRAAVKDAGGADRRVQLRVVEEPAAPIAAASAAPSVVPSAVRPLPAEVTGSAPMLPASTRSTRSTRS